MNYLDKKEPIIDINKCFMELNHDAWKRKTKVDFWRQFSVTEMTLITQTTEKG